MIEIITNKKEENKTIAVVENGKLVEVYEENPENKHKRNEGNIYVGVVKKIIPGMQAAFIDIGTEKNSFIHVKDMIPQVNEKVEKLEIPKIKDVAKVNQKLLVQVQKDSNERKGARTSTHIKIGGKYVILLPQTDILTISQKIEDENEKQRLLKIVKDNLPSNTGAIIRTASENKEQEVIINELNELNSKWLKIYKEYENAEAEPKLLYTSPDIVEKMIIDLQTDKISFIRVNDKEGYESLQKILDKMKIQNIQLELEENVNLLEKYDLEKQIEQSKQRKVWLDCGGFITIDTTEALVAIDVNSGKYTGKTALLEDTIYKVNYEATLEIAKQLKIRDIGGIIIIDYIDMHKPENKEKIEKLLRETLKQDRAKTQVEGFTKLNLMELTRKHICAHNS